MSVNDLIAEGKRLFNNKNIDEAITKLNLALNEIEDKNSQLEEQSDIQCWLGHCYLEQALLNNKDVDEAKELFEQAAIHYKWLFKLAQKLTSKQARLQKQEHAQFGLGRCCLESAIKTKDTTEAKGWFKKAIEHYQQQLKFAKQLADNKTNFGKHNNVLVWLSYCYFAQAKK
ncbi:Sel1 repeat [Aggregatibacter aphrophilus]|uniref:Sel1 repeat n=4 Tax=Aggregatibacter aphrophilus TaxID=732 RepID=A0A336N7I7_AGGAP|nr:Sel1 repeat [Aggregatibacter aphrophilus]